MRLRFVYLAAGLVAMAAFAYAPVSQAAVILGADPPVELAQGGLFQVTVYAEATAGEMISAVGNLSITGNVHQVWDNFFMTPTAKADNVVPSAGWNAEWTPYDTHTLLGAADRKGEFGSALTETNDGTTAITLPTNGPVGTITGFGDLVSGDPADPYLAIPSDALQAQSRVNLAQVVTTNGTALFEVELGDTEGNPYRFLGDNGFVICGDGGVQCGGGGGDTVPPLITPIIANVDLDDPASLAEVTNRQLMGMDETTAVADLVWSNLVYDSGPGKNNPAATDAMMDGDGVFNWNPSGWRMGAHLFNATLADEAGNTTTGLAITVNLIVPEPATFALCGLALVGLVGFTRRRG